MMHVLHNQLVSQTSRENVIDDNDNSGDDGDGDDDDSDGDLLGNGWLRVMQAVHL